MGTAATRANNKYALKKYDRIALVVLKGQKQTIKEHAAQRGKSINKYINDLIDQDMNMQTTE